MRWLRTVGALLAIAVLFAIGWNFYMWLHRQDDRSVQSISCMHTVEHIGLGRYGDPLDPLGDRKAAAELARVLAPGGSLLFVVPVGAPQIMFNAHRIYSYEQVLELFPSLTLREFALIPEHGEDGGLIRHADPALVASQGYGCGCFHFTC